MSQNKIGIYLKKCWLVILYQVKLSFKKIKGFPGGPAVRNPPANTGNTASVLLEGSHMLQSSQAHAPQLLSLHSTACEPQLPKSSKHTLSHKRSYHSEKLVHHNEEQPHCLQPEKACVPQQRPRAIRREKKWAIGNQTQPPRPPYTLCLAAISIHLGLAKLRWWPMAWDPTVFLLNLLHCSTPQVSGIYSFVVFFYTLSPPTSSA